MHTVGKCGASRDDRAVQTSTERKEIMADLTHAPIARRALVAGAAVMGAASAVMGTASAMPAYGAEDGGSTYTSGQTTVFADIEVMCDFDGAGRLAHVAYDVTRTTEFDYFPLFANALDEFCAQLAGATSLDDVDAVSGASLCSEAIRRGVAACVAQACGLDAPSELNPQDEGYDACTTDFSALFQPIKVGSMTLRNRIVKSAGSGPWGGDGTSVAPSAIDLYGQMADGGVSLIILTELASKLGVGLHNTSAEPSDATDEDVVTFLSPLTERIHQGGALVGYQMGIGNPMTPPSVNDDTADDLAAYVQSAADSARKLKAAGVDCIEIKGATTDNLNGYLTRRQNQREDEYGPQSIENRTRLYTDIIRAVKTEAGEDFPVLTLINAVEENDAKLGMNAGYITIEESKAIARALVGAGADLVQVRVGTSGQEINCWAPDCAHAARGADGMTGAGAQFDYASHFEGMMDGSHSGVGSFIPMARAIKEVVNVPVGCAGYMDPRCAPNLIVGAVENGDVDLVFMNRPLNVDPALPNKLQAGQREDIMPCMHCLHCHDTIATGRKVKSSCRANAALQHVYLDEGGMEGGITPTPAETARRVMVIGAGPAGMEAARVAALRGHSVVLYEKADYLGGLLPFAEGVKGRHERLSDYRAYLAHQLEGLNVEVNLGVEVDKTLVDEIAPDAVVVATGGVRDNSVLTPAEGVDVLGFEQAFGAPKAKRIIVLGGSVQAVDMAVYLTSIGREVTMVHGGTFDDFDIDQSGWFKQFIVADLCSRGVKVWNGATVNGLVDGGLSITTDTGDEKVLPCESVVCGADMQADTALADELSAAGYEVYPCGDCAEPHNIARAVYAGHAAARLI